MKKADLIKILHELPIKKIVHVWSDELVWFAMDTKDTAGYLREWLYYDCHVDNTKDVFYLAIDGQEIKDSFDFALYQNSQNKTQPIETHYTQEQQDMMLSCEAYQNFLKSQLN